MKRLTHMGEHGPYWDKSVFDPFAGMEEDIIIERLAAYEETGLTPEQFKNAKETLECFDNIGIKRGNEIVRAEQEGRLVVLPCKVGATVWRIFAPDGREPVISAHTLMSADYIVRWIDKFGKTVFMTREEAESALAADTNVGHTIPINDLYDEDGGDVRNGGDDHA